MARKRIGEMLIEAGLLDAAGLRRALIEQRRWGGQLGSILIDLQLVEEQALVTALSRQLNFPVIDLDRLQIEDEVLELFGAELAKEHQMVPFAIEGKFLDVAMSNPTNLGIIDELRIRTQLNVRTYLAGPKAIERALGRWYGISMGGGGFHPSDMFAGERNLESSEQPAAPVVPAAPATSEHTPPPAISMSLQDQNAAQQARAREIRSLQDRLSHLEALVARDEDVIRKLLGLLVDKGIASREEILERIK